MPIEARLSLRLALALGLAAAIGFGAGFKAPYVLVILVAVLGVAPGPPPEPRKLLALLLIMGASCLWGLLLGNVLVYQPGFGWMLALGGMAVASALAIRPGLTVLATIFILGNSLIAVVASKSSGLALELVQQLLLSTALAGGILHVAHALLPVPAAAAPAVAAPPVPARWVGLRSGLVMALPLTLALVNPSLYMMTLMKGAQLTQQVGESSPRALGRELVGSTAAAGAMALGFWWALQLMPGLFLLVAGLALVGLLVGERLYGVRAIRFGFSWWQNALVTMLILIGPALGDSPFGTDVQMQILKRLGVFIALALYAAWMASLLEMARTRVRQRMAR